MRPTPSAAVIALVSCFVAAPALADMPPPPAPPPAPAGVGADAKPPGDVKLGPDGKPATDAKPDPAKVAAARLAELVKRGMESCTAGDVDDGLPALRAAWAQHEDADLAVALASCEIKASEWAPAAEHLAFALRAKDDPAQRKALEATFLNVRARVGAVKVTVNVDGADVFVGDRFAGSAPLAGEVYVAPGKARISAKKTGYGEIEGEVEVAPQGTVTLALDLAGEGTIAASHRPYSPRSKTPAIVLGALGLTVAGVGAALFAVGQADGGAADNLLAELKTTSSQPCTNGAAGCQTLVSLRQSHDTFVNTGTGVLIGGGALLTAALITGLWANATPSFGHASVQLEPVASPQGGTLLLHGTF
jgi:hypothetical protein